MNPIDIAAAAFWSLRHPLNLAYRFAHAAREDGLVRPANGFTLKDLTAFAESLPAEVLAELAAPHP